MVNEVSDYEFFMLKASVTIAYNKEYQCSKCVLLKTEKYRNRLGCVKGRTREFGEMTLGKCLGNFYNAGYHGLIEVSDNYKNGVMAESGGFYDQPAKYIEAMQLLSSFVNTEEIKRLNSK